MAEETKPQKSTQMSGWWCGVPAIILLLGIIVLIVVQMIPHDFSEHSPARNYKYPAPSAEALNRNLSCDDFPLFKNNKTKYRPLCLNLYKTSVSEFNSAATSGKYDRILVYGENATFDTSLPAKINGVTNLGEDFLRTAKFNDLITIPKELEYYNLDNLDFIPKQLSPYPALSIGFGDQYEVKDRCKAFVGGCATLSFSMFLKNWALAGPVDYGTLLKRDETENSDVLEQEFAWPSDCYANDIIMHETGHNFLVANPISLNGMATSGWLKAPSYFNENLTEIFTDQFADVVCGPGTLKIKKDVIASKPATGGLVEFNGIYPPAMLHPTSYPKDKPCELAIMNTYSHYLAKGDFKTQFTKFVTTFRQAMKENAWEAFDDDQKMANFMLQMLNNDPTEKAFLNEHGCGI